MKELLKAITVLMIAMVMTATPAMAGECTPEDKAKVAHVPDLAVRVMDFSKSSVDCLEDFASKVSLRDMLLVAESNSQVWRNATVEVAKKLQDEGKLVAVVYANDTDGLDTTATTVYWANGVKRDLTPIEMHAPYIINHLVARPELMTSPMYEHASGVWDVYLAVSDVEKPQ